MVRCDNAGRADFSLSTDFVLDIVDEGKANSFQTRPQIERDFKRSIKYRLRIFFCLT